MIIVVGAMLYPVVHDLGSPLSDEYDVVAAISGTLTSNVLRLERRVRGGRGTAAPMSEAVLSKVFAALGFTLEPLVAYVSRESTGREASRPAFAPFSSPPFGGKLHMLRSMQASQSKERISCRRR